MKPLRFSVALQLFVVFTSGALVGALAYRLYTSFPESPPTVKAPPRPPSRVPGRGTSFSDRIVTEMRERLKLRDDQVRKLREVMDATRREVWEARRRSDVEMRAIQEHHQAQIRAMLDPPQIAEYEKMLQEREAQMKRERERGRGRGMPPPKP